MARKPPKRKPVVQSDATRVGRELPFTPPRRPDRTIGPLRPGALNVRLPELPTSELETGGALGVEGYGLTDVIKDIARSRGAFSPTKPLGLALDIANIPGAIRGGVAGGELAAQGRPLIGGGVAALSALPFVGPIAKKAGKAAVKLLDEIDLAGQKIARYETPGGEAWVTYTMGDNGALEVMNIGAQGGELSLGLRNVKAIRDDLATRTGATSMAGHRVSGSKIGRDARVEMKAAPKLDPLAEAEEMLRQGDEALKRTEGLTAERERLQRIRRPTPTGVPLTDVPNVEVASQKREGFAGVLDELKASVKKMQPGLSTENIGASRKAPFYSRLQRAIDAAPFKKGTPQQWKAALAKNVSATERSISGIDDLIDERIKSGQSLTKEEIQGQFDKGQLRFERRDLTTNEESYFDDDARQQIEEERYQEWFSDQQDRARDHLRVSREASSYAESELSGFMDQFITDNADEFDEDVLEQLEKARDRMDVQEFRDLVYKHNEKLYDKTGLEGDLEQYENDWFDARSVEEEAENTWNNDDYGEPDWDWIEDYDPSDYGYSSKGGAEYEAYTEGGAGSGRDYIESLFELQNPSNVSFDSGHFGENNPENLLFHMRTKSRDAFAPSGDPNQIELVLGNEGQWGRRSATEPAGSAHHIEEIQSDWAQAARDDGTMPRGPREILYGDLNSALIDVQLAQRGTELEWLDALVAQAEELPGGKIRINGYTFGPANGSPLGNVRITSPSGVEYERGVGYSLRGEPLRRQAAYLVAKEGLAPSPNLARVQELEEIENEYRALREEITRKVDPTPLGKSDDWIGLAMKHAIEDAVQSGKDIVAWTPGDRQVARYEGALSAATPKVAYDPDLQQLFTFGFDDLNTPLVVRDKEGNVAKVAPNALQHWIGKENAERLLASPRNNLNSTNPMHELATKDMRVGGAGMRFMYDQFLPKWITDYTKKMGAPAKIEQFALEGAEAGQMYPGFRIPPALREKILREGQPFLGLLGAAGLGLGAAGWGGGGGLLGEQQDY